MAVPAAVAPRVPVPAAAAAFVVVLVASASAAAVAMTWTAARVADQLLAVAEAVVMPAAATGAATEVSGSGEPGPAVAAAGAKETLDGIVLAGGSWPAVELAQTHGEDPVLLTVPVAPSPALLSTEPAPALPAEVATTV